MTERKVKLDRANKSILLRALGDVYYGQRANGGSTEVTGRLIPVSYTHLDVYKRQGQGNVRQGHGKSKLLRSTQHRFRVCGNRTVAQPYAQA